MATVVNVDPLAERVVRVTTSANASVDMPRACAPAKGSPLTVALRHTPPDNPGRYVYIAQGRVYHADADAVYISCGGLLVRVQAAEPAPCMDAHVFVTAQA